MPLSPCRQQSLSRCLFQAGEGQSRAWSLRQVKGVRQTQTVVATREYSYPVRYSTAPPARGPSPASTSTPRSGPAGTNHQGNSRTSTLCCAVQYFEARSLQVGDERVWRLLHPSHLHILPRIMISIKQSQGACCRCHTALKAGHWGHGDFRHTSTCRQSASALSTTSLA